jgi:BMFP domain-containing protein YqiC
MSEPDQFAIIPIYSDSTGREAVPQNAVARGSWSAITGRIRDSKQQRQLLTLINDAEHAKGTLQAIREREADVTAREDAVSAIEDEIKRNLLADALTKIDRLVKRIDELEAQRAHDPDDDELPLPPGISDDGPLEAPIKPPEIQDQNDPDMPRSPAVMEDT